MIRSNRSKTKSYSKSKRKNPVTIPPDRILKTMPYRDLIEYINQIPDVKKLKGTGWDGSDYYRYIIDLSDRELLEYIKILTNQWLKVNK